MAQDVRNLLSKNASKIEVCAAVLSSVARNYLNRVVGNRQLSPDKIFFQGATARNKGLVAAFEQLLDREIVVSPFCHVMGALGVALLARQELLESKSPSRFIGLDFQYQKVSLTFSTCDLCQNHCTITTARIGEDANPAHMPSWGYMCGREPEDTRLKVNHHYDLFRFRSRQLRTTSPIDPTVVSRPEVIGLPLLLTNYAYLPLWQDFFQRLGFRIRLSPATNEDVRKSCANLVSADFCFPVKIAHGHVARLLEEDGVDWIFLPHLISNQHAQSASNSYFCPYVQAFPSVISASAMLSPAEVGRCLSPVIDFQWPAARICGTLYENLRRFGVSREQITTSYAAARQSRIEFQKRCQAEGERLLQTLETENRDALVIIGRPYNVNDPGLNLGLPQKIADKGITVIPMDMLPLDPSDIPPEFHNMYWNYGQAILAALRFVQRHPRLHAVYFTNFNCGPDSFLLSYAEFIMNGKPLLILELDEHGADAGYMTRIEAFLDVIRPRRPAYPPAHLHIPAAGTAEIKKRKLWIPNLHPMGARLFAAAFRGRGYRAEVLAQANATTLELGKSCGRGSECFPTILTIGEFIHAVRQSGDEPDQHALFMATAAGPCRFGQYATLHRMILDQHGYRDIPILSPASMNSYQGLDQNLRFLIYQCILMGDILYKCACAIRPYEEEKGLTDIILEKSTRDIEEAVTRGENLRNAMQRAISRFQSIRRRQQVKPLVGIVGEIYVRCNPFANEEVVQQIELAGGEAWLSPVSEWMIYIMNLHRWNATRWGLKNFIRQIPGILKNSYLLREERQFTQLAHGILAERAEPSMAAILRAGQPYVPREFLGEAILTVGRAIEFVRQGAAMVVNCSPFGCMPGTITTAIFQKLQQEMGVPLVSLFYDGNGHTNEKLATYLGNIQGIRPNERVKTSRNSAALRQVNRDRRPAA
jgi:predicted nucleotide-binding protein (sugar kinase/HSP70/actin superfamily)